MTEARETVATIQDHYNRQATPKVWEEVDALRQRVAELEAENAKLRDAVKVLRK